MYENQTYENILQRLLGRIPNNIDKREASVIFNGLAPDAVEFVDVYIALSNILIQTFASTASREKLIERAKERGKIPYEASKAVVKGVFNQSVPIGSRFTCGTLIYKVIDKINDTTYKLECETAGTDGNITGTLIPVEYIEGLTSAEITEILILGEDEEDTESFRERYFSSFDAQAYGGNRADYTEKITSIQGVGSCKIKRVENENENILITILDSSYNKATSVLIDTVQDIIDSQNDGNGASIAPYDHFVTIQTVTERVIDIKLTAQYDTGYTFDNLKTQITEAIEHELQNQRSTWHNQNNIIVRVAQLSAAILSITGILDIVSLELNDDTANIQLNEYEIPVMGELTDE